MKKEHAAPAPVQKVDPIINANAAAYAAAYDAAYDAYDATHNTNDAYDAACDAVYDNYDTDIVDIDAVAWCAYRAAVAAFV